jgi:hypothetical protein
MCNILPIQHVQFFRFLRHLSSGLRLLFGYRLQPVLELPVGPPCPHEWSLPSHMQQVAILRQDIVFLSGMRLELFELLGRRSQ